MRKIEGLPVVDQKLVGVNAHHELHTYIKGDFPDLLALGETTVQGWTGKETLLKRVVAKPIVIFEVVDPDIEPDGESVWEFQYNPARNLR